MQLGPYEIGVQQVSPPPPAPAAIHSTRQYENNRAEISHQPTRQRERQTRRFKSDAHVQQFLSVQGVVLPLFRLGRHLRDRFGVGAGTAAQMLILFGDNPDRIRSEAVPNIGFGGRHSCGRRGSEGSWVRSGQRRQPCREG